MTARLAVETLGLSRAGRTVLSGITLAVDPGEIVCLVGPNGAGKSTLLAAIRGALPASGTVRMDGEAVNGKRLRRHPERLAFLPQERIIAWPITVEALVALGRIANGADGTLAGLDDEGRGAVERALADCALTDFRHRLVGTLSGGEKARALLARALCIEAPLLLADEPAAGLDPAQAARVFEALRRRARATAAAALVVVHDLALAAAFADRIAVLAEGQLLAFGRPETALDARILAKAYGIGFRQDGQGGISPDFAAIGGGLPR
ncbi:MAG: ABC transporter ATP-binding protein [Hyphomicrobiaceae bacterium]|nr:ABC transporter ATP-binding protein [Hyphomicrobiaceae bacterium]